MLSLKEIRQYISGLGITTDDRVYIGKMDNKKDHSIGVYNRRAEDPPVTALGGREYSTYDIKRISLLMHWDRDILRAERAAYELYEKLLNESSIIMGDIPIRFIILRVPEPVDVGTDEKGIYEYVIWLDIIYQKERMR